MLTEQLWNLAKTKTSNMKKQLSTKVFFLNKWRKKMERELTGWVLYPNSLDNGI